MANRVLPTVSLIFPCRDAIYDLAEERWVLSDIWTVVLYPEGVHGNFDVPAFSVYAHLTDGVGASDLSVEMRFVREDGITVVIGRGSATRLEFPSGNQLLALDTAFQMENVPFDRPGDYEFAVMANYAPLAGATAKLRVLDLGVPL